MKIIDINNENALSEAVNVLKNGGIVMHPTETCYGLTCDALNENALNKLYTIKEMPLDKPVSILVADFDMAFKYGKFEEQGIALAKKYWPGALSIVVPRSFALPEFLNKGNEYVSMRISGDEFSTEIVRNLTRPITTTSANASGEMQMYFPDFEKYEDFLNKIDLILDAGKIPENKPSTIVKLADGQFTILRQGDIIINE